jgi:uncharacterized protein YceH (UPF0502 family)
MYAFPDMAELEASLALLLEAEPPLAERLPRAPGARESRLRHTLGEVGAEPASTPAAIPESGRLEALAAEVAVLRTDLAALREAFEAFRAQF